MERFEALRPHSEDDASLAHAARQAGISVRTAERWLARYRQSGLAGLARSIRSDAEARRLPDDLLTIIEGIGLKKPLRRYFRDRYFRRISVTISVISVTATSTPNPPPHPPFSPYPKVLPRKPTTQEQSLQMKQQETNLRSKPTQQVARQSHPAPASHVHHSRESTETHLHPWLTHSPDENPSATSSPTHTQTNPMSNGSAKSY
jgi:transposase-like protein